MRTVVAQAGPLMHNQDAGTLALDSSVPSQMAFQRRTILLVLGLESLTTALADLVVPIATAIAIVMFLMPISC